MNRNSYAALTMMAVVYAGATIAVTDEQRDDILYGVGAVEATAGEPYVQAYQGPQDIEHDMLYNRHELKDASPFVPYVQITDERDNSEDILSNLHRSDRQDRIVAR